MTAKTRSVSGELFPAFPESFAAVRPPRPVLGGEAGIEEYRLKWRALVHAAEGVGCTPAELAGHGVVGLNARREAAGQRPWSLRTICYYAKLVRYSGLAWDDFPVGDADVAVTGAQARVLWAPARWTHPAAWRTAALCRMAWLWPAPPGLWLSLPGDAVQRVGERGVLISPPAASGVAQVQLPVGGVEWDQWLAARAGIGASDTWAFCTTESGRNSEVGAQLSLRGFQASFARHARESGLPALSYERYRVAAVADGAVAVGERGRARGARRSRSSARPAVSR